MSRGSPARDRSALDLADEARALVQVEPRRALALAERALQSATAAGDVAAEITTRHALAWAQKVLGDGRTGRETLRVGIRLAHREGDLRGAAILGRSLAVSYAHDGQARAAERELAAALARLPPRERARSQVHALEVHRARSSDPELDRRVRAEVDRALAHLRREGDELWEARLLFNRGLLNADRGELGRAGADLRRAQELYERTGAAAAALNAEIVRAELALLQGDLVACLQTLGEVEASIAARQADHEYRVDNLEECQFMALAQARLLPEARAAGERYVATCARAAQLERVPRALLDLAAVAALSGDAASARTLAARAQRLSAARGRPANAALARVALLRAQLAGGDVPRSALAAGARAAETLEQAGWDREALRARLVLARVSLARDTPATARVELERARGLASRGSLADRVELAHARALLLAAEGKPGAAARQVESGLRLLDDHQAALGSIELRAAAAGIGSELARDGLRLARSTGRPERILAAAERQRANALRLPAVRAPADTRLRRLQAELRRVEQELHEAEDAGRLDRGAAARRARFEAAIRARTRATGGATARVAPTVPVEALRALGGRALVEYVECDGELGAVTIAGGRLAYHDLGRVGAEAELEWLHFGLAGLARASTHGAERRAALGTVRAAACALDDLLVRPLLPDAPLVLVPTGALHGVPWGALPSLRGRPVTVAPSLTTWAALAGRPRSRARRAVLVAGPRLRHAAAEVRELGALLPGSTALHGRAATAETTLAALDGARLAHLACHGRFRADSPLFSSLELADGPLDVYELQRLKRPPELVVLSACDLALSQLHPGDELLGLAAALLGMGTRTIVASVVPVPDAGARRLMLAFHRRLKDGERPAAALAAAQAKTRTAGFVCLGDG